MASIKELVFAHFPGATEGEMEGGGRAVVVGTEMECRALLEKTPYVHQFTTRHVGDAHELVLMWRTTVVHASDGDGSLYALPYVKDGYEVWEE